MTKFTNSTLALINAEFPAFGAALRLHQKAEGLDEVELLSSLRRCLSIIEARDDAPTS